MLFKLSSSAAGNQQVAGYPQDTRTAGYGQQATADGYGQNYSYDYSGANYSAGGDVQAGGSYGRGGPVAGQPRGGAAYNYAPPR